jgi:putative restriction endonuclease
LCPNHHVLFDYGAFSIRDDFSLIGLAGTLLTLPAHRIDRRQLRYHREWFKFGR